MTPNRALFLGCFLVCLGCGGGARPVGAPAERPPEVCLLPPDPGPCEGYFPRFHFDPDTGDCREFIYGGCQGNDNNFKTREECVARCPPEK